MLKLFISYSRGDGATFSSKLRDDLTNNGMYVWQDVKNLESGRTWNTQILDAIRDSDIVIIVLTPEAVKSKWVRREWEAAEALQKMRLPILAESCKIPVDLKNIQYLDLSNDVFYSRNFPVLVRDILSIRDEKNLNTLPSSAYTKYAVYNPTISAIGDNAMMVNFGNEWNGKYLELMATIKDPIIQKTVEAITQTIGYEHISNEIAQQAIDIIKKAIVDVGEGVQETANIPHEVKIAQDIVDAPNLDVQHKLKLTIPIVPFLVSYEGEMGVGSKLNLEALWERMRGWLKQKRKR